MHGKIVLAFLDGEFTIKRLCVKGKTVSLVPENDKYHPIVLTQGREFETWGVVKCQGLYQAWRRPDDLFREPDRKTAAYKACRRRHPTF